MNNQVIFIIYVKDQEKSKIFYENILGEKPSLHVPGMTEFTLSPNTKLGLMPEDGIMRILENQIPHPAKANGIPRNEIYLYVDDPDAFYDRIVMNGGTGISSTALRNWGDYAAYGMDLDGNILAFAKKGEV